ncbi:hypothetical protein BH11GEM1_BH11GEM1_17980 [soil metagenome]
MTSAPLRALLAGSIDYAGLFPPAALPLAAVCANYCSDSTSAESWALGRLVVPANRLREVVELLPPNSAPWRVAALIGDDLAGDVVSIREVNATGTLAIETAESRAPSINAIVAAARALDGVCALYAEIPVVDDPAPLVDAIAAAGARAKIRTGGVTPDAFPAPGQVARFIRCCSARSVAFKATAGLHHPMRGEYRLTYDTNAPCSTMFGFLNVIVAAALARIEDTDASLVALLEERDPTTLQFDPDGIRWREHFLPTHLVAETRNASAISFGSCSFREPIDDLHQLGLL